MGKDKKGLNPADAFRREQKKHEAKKNKFKKQKVHEVRDLLDHPSKIQEKIDELQRESDQNRLDKTIKDQIKHYKEMLTIAINKQKINGTYKAPGSSDDSKLTDMADSADNMDHRAETSSNVRDKAVEMPPMQIPRRPDESIYYHPVYNPLGLPPAGQQQAYRPLAPTMVTTSGPTLPNMFHPRGPPILPGQPRAFSPYIPLGGMNGIPPPPPPSMRGPPAIGSSSMGNSSANSGVPPPPPPEVLPFQSPFANFPPQMVVLRPTVEISENSTQNYKAKQRPMNVNSYDPLDPAAKGYVNRFSKEAASKPSTLVNAPPPTQMPEPIVSVPAIQDIPIMAAQQASQAIQDAQTYGFPIPAPPPPPPPPPPPEKPDDFFATVGSIVNLEELMRRRYEVPSKEEESYQELTAPGPAFPSSVEDIQISLPNVEEVLRRRFEVVDDVESIPPSGPNASDMTVSHSSGPKSTKQANDEVVPLSLAILGDYGDDDDSDEETDSAESKNKEESAAATNFHSIAVFKHEPHALPKAPSLYDQRISLNEEQRTLNHEHVPTIHQMMTTPQLSQDTSHNLNQDKKEAPLKIVKTDPKLTQFVPAAVRVKRPAPSNSVLPSKIHKPTSSVEEKVIPEPSIAIKSSAPQEKTSTNQTVAVDDAYKAFLAEMEALENMS